MTTALFIGRFQPFHKGHLSDIKTALKECDELIIAIGSSEKSHSKINPFSFEERLRMIEDTLIKEGLSDYTVFAVPDINNNSKWVEHVKNLLPKFDVVYTGNPKTERLFKKARCRIRKVDMVPDINSTAVRKHMLEGKRWKSMVPEPVLNYIKELGGTKRIREISKS